MDVGQARPAFAGFFFCFDCQAHSAEARASAAEARVITLAVLETRREAVDPGVAGFRTSFSCPRCTRRALAPRGGGPAEGSSVVR